MLEQCIKDVLEFDEYFHVSHENLSSVENLVYNVLAISGEAGEAANAVKKLWRDGNVEKRLDEVSEELVDVLIYICKAVVIANIDFEKAWKAKIAANYEKWKNKETWERQTTLQEGVVENGNNHAR